MSSATRPWPAGSTRARGSCSTRGCGARHGASSRSARPAPRGATPGAATSRNGDLPVAIHLGNCAGAAGAHAERFCAHESQLFEVPEDLSDEAAVLSDPVSVSLRSILLRPPEAVRPVLVYGSGTLAFAAIGLLRHLYPRLEIWAATRAGFRSSLAAQTRCRRRADLDARTNSFARSARRTGKPAAQTLEREGLAAGRARRSSTTRSAAPRPSRPRSASLQTGGHARGERRRAAEALRVDAHVLQGAPRRRLERLRHRGGRRRPKARLRALLRLRRGRPRPDAGRHAPLPAWPTGARPCSPSPTRATPAPSRCSSSPRPQSPARSDRRVEQLVDLLGAART